MREGSRVDTESWLSAEGGKRDSVEMISTTVTRTHLEINHRVSSGLVFPFVGFFVSFSHLEYQFKIKCQNWHIQIKIKYWTLAAKKMFFDYIYFNVKSWRMTINSQSVTETFTDFHYSFFIIVNSNHIVRKRAQG